MFEHRSEPVLGRLAFLARLVRALLGTMLIVAISVLGGTMGYHAFLGLSWSSAFHHACLVLGEHSPQRQPQSISGEIFTGLYVLYARLVFFSLVAILTLPLLHRILHELHLDAVEAGSREGGDEG